MTRVLIYGGRDWTDAAVMGAALDALHAWYGFTYLINGSAPGDDADPIGADALALAWAKDRGIPGSLFPAHWTREGRAAGPLRNQRMLKARPDLGVEFPGGDGTNDLRRRLDLAGIPVAEIRRQK